VERDPILFYVVAGIVGVLFGGNALRLLWSAWARGLVQKELRHFFLSPIAWLTMTGFALVNGFFFLFLLQVYTGSPNLPMVQVFFGGGFFWVLQLIVVPAITMRLIAEERHRGTLEPLLTAPVTDAEVVFGKFTGALTFYAALWAPTLALLAAAFHYATPTGFWASVWATRAEGLGFFPAALGRMNEVMDLGPVLTAYLGTLLMGAAWIAIGLLASSFARNQVVAFIGSFVTLLCFYSVGQLETLIQADPTWLPGLREALRYASFSAAFSEFPRGVVDTRAVAYFITLTALGLFFTTRVVESQRWR
jgi:ABC-2 type transport system permease protein